MLDQPKKVNRRRATFRNGDTVICLSFARTFDLVMRAFNGLLVLALPESIRSSDPYWKVDAVSHFEGGSVFPDLATA